jgi:hypothetical protein
MTTENMNILSEQGMGKLISLLNPEADPHLVIKVVKEYATQQNKDMLELLRECKSHLEWIGYGDSYERECSEDLRNELNELNLD